MAQVTNPSGSIAARPATAALSAVHSIDHYALLVPDIAAAEAFTTAFGLTVHCKDQSADVVAGDGHVWAKYYQGARRTLAYLSFNCFVEDFQNLRKQIGEICSLETSGDFVTSEGIWFRDCDGNLLQVKIGRKTSPDAKSPSLPTHACADQRGAVTRSNVAQVRPSRLSHILLFTPDVCRAVDFYRRALGLCLSDRSGSVIAFSHAPHGCDHHLVAFAKSSAKGWHHAAWDVPDIDEVGRGAAQMAAAGYRNGWGTGRHVLGSNYFHYIQDPWGSFCEYSANIDYISAGQSWPAGDFQPEDSLFQWGPEVPDYFILNTEA